MIVKQLHFDEEGREKLKNGIQKISTAVKSTLGPSGRPCLLESEHHVGGLTVTKDGVTVAKTIHLEDPVENLAVQMMRQAADKTATMAGDGTTTSIVLAEALINKAEEHMREDSNITEVIRWMNFYAKKIDDKLVKMSKKVTGRRLVDVATVSSNNDQTTGKMIADAFSKVDMVTVENSKTSSTYAEIVKGIKIDRGFSSKFFVNDHRKNECVLDDCYVLITDHEVTNLGHLEGVLKQIVEANKPLLIIGEMNLQTLSTLNINVMKGNIKACNIIPPSMGYRKEELMTDIAKALGGHYYSDKTGDTLALVTMDGLGRAKRVVVGQDTTTVIPMEPIDSEYIQTLLDAKSLTTDPTQISFLEERISNISGGVGVIYVGANSDIEQKELRDRFDDAVCAVKAAKEEGILPGGGIALTSALSALNQYIKFADGDELVAIETLYSALEEPFKQILVNAGMDPMEKGQRIISQDSLYYGLNVKDGQYGDMLKMGIVDPTKVTRNALKNAVSVATTILSTNVIITNIRSYENS